MEGLLVLPKDIRVVPVAELPAQVREQVEAQNDGYAIARSNSRVPSKIVDAEAWSLLEQFREPKTLVDAVLGYSRSIKAKPADVFEQAFPLLNGLYQTRLLVDADAQDATAITPTYEPGDEVAGYGIVRNVQTLPDTELYEVRSTAGTPAALKIARPAASPLVLAAFEREAKVLARLESIGAVPALLQSGEYDGRRFLVMEWREGQDAATTAATLRTRAGATGLTDFCQRILDAYADLHEAGILHGDVHARNVIAGPDGDLAIVDFGLSAAPPLPKPPRGGIPMFHEPEYARRELDGAAAPPATPAGEQYSVAALVYLLLCGAPYVDFATDRSKLLRQVIESDPVRFGARGRVGFASVEEVLRRALSKDPARRWTNMRAFADAFRSASAEDHAALRRAEAMGPSSREDFVRRVLDRAGKPASDLQVRGIRSPLASLTYGAAGVACGLHRISVARDDEALFARADGWAEFASNLCGRPDAFYESEVQISPETVGKVSPYHTESGVHAVRALLAHARSDSMVLDRHIGQFLAASQDHSQENDLTLGRGSTLIALTLLAGAAGMRPYFGEFGDRLLKEVWLDLDGRPPIAESAPSAPLGLAHGWAGYLYSSLRWAQAAKTSPYENVRERLEQLSQLGFAGQHGLAWPFHLRDPRRSLDGWCNGNAGFLFLWTLAHQVYGDRRYLALAEQTASEVAHARTELATLCCGAAGEGYALLALYRHTGERRWLQAAEDIAESGIAVCLRSEARNDTGMPLSLYKGDLGLAVLLEDLRNPEFARMPFFETDSC